MTVAEMDGSDSFSEGDMKSQLLPGFSKVATQLIKGTSDN